MLNLILIAGWGSFYSGLIVLAIGAEHFLFARRLARHELIRTTMGVATVMTIAAPFATWGIFNPAELWAFILVGFGVAGITTVALYALEGGLPTYIIKQPEIEGWDGRGLAALADMTGDKGE